MIETVWPYLAIMLLAAGLFPSLEKRFRWRFFSVLPPIVLTYLFVTALAVGGLWSPTAEIQSAQRALTAHLLPALLFLLMVTCDLRAILARRARACWRCSRARWRASWSRSSSCTCCFAACCRPTAGRCSRR